MGSPEGVGEVDDRTLARTAAGAPPAPDVAPDAADKAEDELPSPPPPHDGSEDHTVAPVAAPAAAPAQPLAPDSDSEDDAAAFRMVHQAPAGEGASEGEGGGAQAAGGPRVARTADEELAEDADDPVLPLYGEDEDDFEDDRSEGEDEDEEELDEGDVAARLAASAQRTAARGKAAADAGAPSAAASARARDDAFAAARAAAAAAATNGCAAGSSALLAAFGPAGAACRALATLLLASAAASSRVAAFVAQLRADWERDTLPGLALHARAYWRLRSTPTRDAWAREADKLESRLATLAAELAKDADDASDAALLRRCAALQPTLIDLLELQYKLGVAQLPEIPAKPPPLPLPAEPDAMEVGEAGDSAAEGAAAAAPKVRKKQARAASGDGGADEGSGDGESELSEEDEAGKGTEAAAHTRAAGAGDLAPGQTRIMVMHGQRVDAPPPRAARAARAADGGAEAPVPVDMEEEENAVGAAAAPPLLTAHVGVGAAVEVRVHDPRARRVGVPEGQDWHLLGGVCDGLADPDAGGAPAADGSSLVRVRYAHLPGLVEEEDLARVRPPPPHQLSQVTDGHARVLEVQKGAHGAWVRAYALAPPIRYPQASKASGAELLTVAQLHSFAGGPCERLILAATRRAAARAPAAAQQQQQAVAVRERVRVAVLGDAGESWLSWDTAGASCAPGARCTDSGASYDCRRALEYDSVTGGWRAARDERCAVQLALRHMMADRRDVQLRDTLVKPRLQPGAAGLASAAAELARRLARAPWSSLSGRCARVLLAEARKLGAAAPPRLRMMCVAAAAAPEAPEAPGSPRGGDEPDWAFTAFMGGRPCARPPARAAHPAPRAAAAPAAAAAAPAPRAAHLLNLEAERPTAAPRMGVYNSMQALDMPLYPDRPEVLVAGRLAQKLKTHQWEGVRFMWENLVDVWHNCSLNGGEGLEQPGCVLAHSMGLGKTLEVLTLLHTLCRYELGQRILIIVPKNVLANWAAEWATWLPADTPGLNRSCVYVLGLQEGEQVGHRHQKVKQWHEACVGAAKDGPGAVLLVSTNLFSNLVCVGDPPAPPKAKRRGRPPAQRAQLAAAHAGEPPSDAPPDVGAAGPSAPAPPAPKAPKPVCAQAAQMKLWLLNSADVVVVDEAHELRNAESKRALACAKISTMRRLALTGSPMQNNLMEYWAMMDFVRPSDMGTEANFKKDFVDPIEAGQGTDGQPASEAQLRRMRSKMSILWDMSESYVHRRDSSLLSKALPPKAEYVLRLGASALQHALLCTFFAQAQGCTLSGFQVEAFTRKVFDVPHTLLRACVEVARTASTAGRTTAAQLAAQLVAETQDEGAEAEAAVAEEAEVEDASRVRAAPVVDEPTAAAHVKLYLALFQVFVDHGVVLASIADADADAGEECATPPPPPLPPVPCAKMWALIQIACWCIAAGEKLLIFSQWTVHLDAMQEALDQALGWQKDQHYLRMDGTTASDKRQQLINHFNSPACTAQAFLLSTKACAVGVNLVGASRMVIFDTCWNPSTTIQAIHRFYRYGQTRPTFVYRLVASTWLEDRMYAVAVLKERLAALVVDRYAIARCFGALEAAKQQAPPAPQAPDTSALASWAAGKGDALLSQLLAGDWGGFAAGGPPWVCGLGDHGDALRLDASQELSDRDKTAAADEFLLSVDLTRATPRELRLLNRQREREVRAKAEGAAHEGAGDAAVQHALLQNEARKAQQAIAASRPVRRSPGTGGASQGGHQSQGGGDHGAGLLPVPPTASLLRIRPSLPLPPVVRGEEFVGRRVYHGHLMGTVTLFHPTTVQWTVQWDNSERFRVELVYQEDLMPWLKKPKGGKRAAEGGGQPPHKAARHGETEAAAEDGDGGVIDLTQDV